jgi:cyclophilin family peptidyl-prolyl cis-trans isomerase
MLRLPTRLLPCLLLPVLVLAGCGGSDADDEASATPAPAASATATGCEKVSKPAAKSVDLAKPTEELDPAKTYVATVSTSCGDFAITLDAKRAPKTGGSFKYLADKGVFDNTSFHRVVPGFVIQGGDPSGDGTGGPGYSVVEAPPQGLQYVKGVVAMAKTQMEAPGTSGSQFYVVTGEDAQLPPEYALLGKISAGQDVVDKIGVAETDPTSQEPLDPILIRSVKVTAG